MAALRGMIGGHFGRSNGLPVLTLIVAWFVNYCRHLFGCWNGICVGGEFPVSIWSGGVAIIRWVERGLELKSASVGDNKNIVFFFFVTSPLISRLEKKKTKDPHLRMAAIILFTASIPAPIDPRVTGKSLNQWRFCSRFWSQHSTCITVCCKLSAADIHDQSLYILFVLCLISTPLGATMFPLLKYLQPVLQKNWPA